MLFWVVMAVLAILFIWLYFKFFKIPKIKNFMFIDGSLGTGKSFYSVALAVRLYKREIRRYKIARWLFGPFQSIKEPRNRFTRALKNVYPMIEPVLYSNIPLRGIKHTKLSKDLLLRKVRPAPRSVVLIDDLSIVVDQMAFKDPVLNKRLSLFFKLWRHSSKGGYIICNSQSVNDIHHGARYALSDYLYLHSSFRLPFIRVLRAQEVAYCPDASGSQVMRVSDRDVEESLKRICVLSKYRKYYDTYCYSILTDGLEVFRRDSYLKFLECAKDADPLTLDELTRKLMKGEL